MAPIILIAMLFLASSCQQVSFDGKSTSSSKDAEQEQAPPSPPANPPSTAEDESIAIPVDIHGSYLRCETEFNADHDVLCAVFSENGEASNVEIKNAFIGLGTEIQWQATTFAKAGGVGEYLVHVPNEVTNDFSVALNYGEAAPIFDWVSKDLSLASRVNDGGFEGFTVSNSNFAIFTSEQSPFWKVQRSDTSTCQFGDPAFEIQVFDGIETLQTAFQGQKHMELDSSCPVPNTPNIGQNALVYQDLALKQDHVYFFRFRASFRKGNPDPSHLRVMIGDERVLDQAMTVEDWTNFSFIRRVTSASVRISFEERGLENAWGTLIDSVEVMELGR